MAADELISRVARVEQRVSDLDTRLAAMTPMVASVVLGLVERVSVLQAAFTKLETKLELRDEREDERENATAAERRAARRWMIGLTVMILCALVGAVARSRYAGALMRREPTSNKTLLVGFVILAVAVLILIVGGSYGFVKLTNQSATQASQQASLIDGFEQSNVLRAQENRTQYADFVVFSFVEQRFLKPTPSTTPAQIAVTRQFAPRLRAAVRRQAWTPLTDCRKAVNEKGVGYKPAQPIPFYKHMAPKSALR